jgi:hypothetical protein
MHTVKAYRNFFVTLFVAFIYLHYLNYFNYVDYNPSLGGAALCRILGALMLFCYFIYKYPISVCPSKKYVAGFIFLPMLSFIPCYLERGQSFFASLWAYFPFMILFIYFFLHKETVPIKFVINILTIYAVARTSLLIIEQFTYPHYWFSFRREYYDAYGNLRPIEIRSGIYRFYIFDTYL